MRRGSSSLFIILGLFLILAAGAAGAIMFYAPNSGISLAAPPAQLPPTPEPMVPIVKAEIDIQAGTVLSSTDGLLKMEMVPMSQFMSDVNLSSVEEARNMVVTSGINASEFVRKDMLRVAGLSQKIPAAVPGQSPVKAFPLQVNSLSGVADLLQAGDHVDVLASFSIDTVTFTPGAPRDDEERGTLETIIERMSVEGATKVLLQDVEVLDIIKPAPVSAEGTEPTPEPAPATDGTTSNGAAPTVGNTLNPGTWLIIVAVTNQEAEVLRFALDRGIGITTVLRRAGDHTTERTVGATMRILVDNYGMPMPSYPQVVQQPAAAIIEGVPQLPQVRTPSFVPTMTPENP
jgi:pilus assembly protein CpaB